MTEEELKNLKDNHVLPNCVKWKMLQYQVWKKAFGKKFSSEEEFDRAFFGLREQEEGEKRK